MIFRNRPGRIFVNPGINIANIKNEIDRVYDEVFTNREQAESVGNLIPAVNIEENTDEFKITAELPGVSKEDVKITFENGKLSISGEKQPPADVSQQDFHRFEIVYGNFTRSFDIPVQVKVDAIEARFENGLLIINLPKEEKEKPQEIKINIK